LQNQLNSASASHNSYKEIPISVEEIVAEIEINAPSSRIWHVLTDFENIQLETPLSKKKRLRDKE
jgi:hypothetical protein